MLENIKKIKNRKYDTIIPCSYGRFTILVYFYSFTNKFICHNIVHNVYSTLDFIFYFIKSCTHLINKNH